MHISPFKIKSIAAPLDRHANICPRTSRSTHIYAKLNGFFKPNYRSSSTLITRTQLPTANRILCQKCLCCSGYRMPGWLRFFPNGWICRLSASWTRLWRPKSIDRNSWSVCRACDQQLLIASPTSMVLDLLVTKQIDGHDGGGNGCPCVKSMWNVSRCMEVMFTSVL